MCDSVKDHTHCCNCCDKTNSITNVIKENDIIVASRKNIDVPNIIVGNSASSIVMSCSSPEEVERLQNIIKKRIAERDERIRRKLDQNTNFDPVDVKK